MKLFLAYLFIPKQLYIYHG